MALEREHFRLVVILAVILAAIGMIWHLGSRPSVAGVEPAEAYVVAKNGDIFSNGEIYRGPGPVELHTVVRFEGGDGDSWYACDVDSLVINGKRIPEEKVRPWSHEKIDVRMVYFTVEPELPYYYIESLKDLDGFDFKHFFLSGGPGMWSYTASQAALNARIYSSPPVGEWAGEALETGTMRFRVMVDFYFPDLPISSTKRISSPGKDDLSRITTVISGLGEPESSLFTLTSFANLPGVGLGEDVPEAVRQELAPLFENRWAYGTVQWLQVVKSRPEPFRVFYNGSRVTLKGNAVKWGDVAFAGDLLSLPMGTTVLLEDDGDGILNNNDRVMTKVQGPMCVTSLAEALSRKTYALYISSGHEYSR